MALQGCCCCGLRGGAKAVGILFLVISLLMLIGVIAAWILCFSFTTDSQGFGFDTPEGQFGVRARETHWILGGSGGDLEVDVGKLGKFGVSGSENGWRLHTPGGDLSSDGRRHSVPGLDRMTEHQQALLIAATVYVVLCVSFNSMLIHGTNNDSSCPVLGWLVFYGIHFVLHSISALGGLIVGARGVALGNGDHQVHVLIVAVIGVLFTALVWFWWALVLTFYRELCEGTRGFKYHRDVSLQEPPTPLVTGPAVQRKAEMCA